MIELAERMLADYDEGNPGTAFAQGLHLELSEAWTLQHAVAGLREARGEVVVGYKVGCVCEHNQRNHGLTHPVWGRLWSTEQHNDGAVLKKDDFANISLEAEFAVSLSQGIDPENTSMEVIADSVAELFPVIELHNLVWRGQPPRGAELIANNCIHAGVVRGRGVQLGQSVKETDLALIFDGETVDAWSSLQWPRDILQAVQWLAEKLAEEDTQLKAGDLILTGAWGPPIPLGEKSRVEVVSSAFGKVSASFS